MSILVDGKPYAKSILDRAHRCQRPEKYKAYASGAAAAFQQYGAKYLVRGGSSTAAEGQARSRNVVIEFPSYQAAVDCYHSKEYQAARAHRLGAATGEIVIVEGVEP